MRPLVFLGGITASGKTTLAQKMASEGIAKHVAAGDLIKQAKADRASGRIRVLDSTDAAGNQDLLIRAFKEVVEATSLPVILDGHFVITTEAGSVPVQSSVFAGLGVNVLALLSVAATEAAARLIARHQRPIWWDGTVAALEKLQAVEHQVAAQVALECNLRLVELKAPSNEELLRLLVRDGA